MTKWDHEIPFSPEAVEVLHVARSFSGRGPLAFPNIRDANSPPPITA